MEQNFVGRSGRDNFLLGHAAGEIKSVEQQAHRPSQARDKPDREAEERQPILRRRCGFVLLAFPEQLGDIAEQKHAHHQLQVHWIAVLEQPRPQPHCWYRSWDEVSHDVPSDALTKGNQPGQ